MYNSPVTEWVTDWQTTATAAETWHVLYIYLRGLREDFLKLPRSGKNENHLFMRTMSLAEAP